MGRRVSAPTRPWRRRYRVGAGLQAEGLERAFDLFPSRTLDDADARLSAIHSWTTDEKVDLRRAEDEYLARVNEDDLIDNYVRPYIASHPEDFPRSVEDL